MFSRFESRRHAGGWLPHGVVSAISYLSFLPPAEDALANLSPATAAWFRANVGGPTAIQRGAIASVSRGQSALLSAPTGTGKTLAAFLPLIDRLPATLPEGIVGLVITPLKALATDQFKNLATLIDTIAPRVRIGVRTGDTPPSQRRAYKLVSPHLLWTTPESLALLLTQDEFRRQVESLRWVVVDEVHALAGTDRGAHLLSVVEARLCALATRDWPEEPDVTARLPLADSVS